MSDPQVPFFKKSTKPKNARKRIIPDDDDDASKSVSPDSKPETPATISIQQLKKSKNTNIPVALSSTSVSTSKAASISHQYSSSNSAAQLSTNDATRQLDIDGTTESAAKSDIILNAEQLDDGMYRGLNGYVEYVNKKTENVNQISAGTRIRAGPLRGQTNVRISSRFDYQPDVCKDYKLTGYCGYGDSCKFMHDRGDYKTGWQLDKEWEEMQKKKREESPDYLIHSDAESAGNSDKESDEDDLPFACLYCRKPFKDPVVTKCTHYFCEKCALEWNKKSPKCYVCAKPTNGVFLVAKELLNKIAEIKKKNEEREMKIREMNQGIEEVAEEEEEEES